MKTTIDISHPLFKETKRYAGLKGMTFKQVLESALREFLKIQFTKKPRTFHLRRHPFKGRGLAEGLTEGDWNAIRERAYEGRGG